MIVRIHFRPGPSVRRMGAKNQRLAMGFATLLVPAILAAWVLALWRLAADLGKAEEFAIETGIWSHWQVWLAIAIALHVAEAWLKRYARRTTVAPVESSTVPQ